MRSSRHKYTLFDEEAAEDLPLYEARTSLKPWLQLLQRPAWAHSDLALFLPAVSSNKGCGMGWTAEYATHVRMRNPDPCRDVVSDFMYDAITEEVRDFIRARIPPELRSAYRFDPFSSS